MQLLQSLTELLNLQNAGPYVSLYQPTHRQHPDNKQDPILFGNLVKEVEDSLGREHSKETINEIMAPFHALAADSDFWNHTPDGIAVFGGKGFFRVKHLQRQVAPLAVVADSFHIKPLLRILQSADRFQVLGVNRQEVRLFEGNRDGFDEIALAAGVPAKASDVLGDDLSEPVTRVHSFGASPSATAGRGSDGTKTGGIRYGHGAKSDVIDQQTERFFRAVDRGIAEYHSKPSGLPLILAALPEHHAMFRAVSHNTQLLDAGVEINPESLSVEELRSAAWQVMEPVYVSRLAEFVDQFGAASGSQQGSADLSDVARAAVAGRVRVLLLEADRHIPGHIDPKTGAIRPDDLEHPGIDDMLDDLAEQVLRTGGEVIMVPAERMPVTTGLAAIYRF
jgi:hypothetical protein